MLDEWRMAASDRSRDHGRVIELTEPQIWTLIVGLLSLGIAVFAVISTLFVRVVRAEIGGLRGELRGEIAGLRGELRGEIEGLRKEMTGRFEAVHVRMDALDRDIQGLVKRTFGLDRE